MQYNITLWTVAKFSLKGIVPKILNNIIIKKKSHVGLQQYDVISNLFDLHSSVE